MMNIYENKKRIERSWLRRNKMFEYKPSEKAWEIFYRPAYFNSLNKEISKQNQKLN